MFGGQHVAKVLHTLCPLETTPNSAAYVSNDLLVLMIPGWLGSARRLFWARLGSPMKLRASGCSVRPGGYRRVSVTGLGPWCCLCLGLWPRWLTGHSWVGIVAQASLCICGRLPRKCRWKLQGLRGLDSGTFTVSLLSHFIGQ